MDPQIYGHALGTLFTTQKISLNAGIYSAKKKLNILMKKRWFNKLKAKDYLQKHTKVKGLDCYLVNCIYSNYIIWIIPAEVPSFL